MRYESILGIRVIYIQLRSYSTCAIRETTLTYHNPFTYIQYAICSEILILAGDEFSMGRETSDSAVSLIRLFDLCNW